MKIATLQFSPRVGDIARNFSLAESLLMREEKENLLLNLDLLILPELAFAGYNHPSLAAIAPYLEPTAAGPSTRWATRTARRLNCTVAVGYAEAAEGEGNWNTNFDATITSQGKGFNSLVFVDCTGDVVAHYRKSFLYYTDEAWAQEGSGFLSSVLPLGQMGRRVKVAAGICMDINPYKFEAGWTEYEFANFARVGRVKLVVISMAWLTRLGREEMSGEGVKGMPDMDTVGYWVERFRPLIGPEGLEEEVIVVCANRTGEEGVAERIGEVRYAGSSCVMGLTKGDGQTNGDVRIWDIMGRAQEGVMIVDTEKEPRYAVTKKAPAWNSIGDEPVDTNGHETVLGDTASKAMGGERAGEEQSVAA
jgi:protein N-terminal amidase